MTTRSAMYTTKVFAVLATVAGGAMLTADFADARSGRGGSSGSRGDRTFSTPPATNTAPRSAQPIQKSITQPGRPSPAANSATQASRGGSMMRNLLLGGLIGAGLASLFGAGMLANVMGFLLQGLLIAGLVMLVIAFFRSRGNKPAMATANAGAASTPPDANVYRANASGMGTSAPTLNIGNDDFTAFERLLKEVQLSYANSDIDGLGKRVTPEMLSIFAHELDENKRSGVSNDLSEPTLLQGDLAEAWHEPGGEYATVAMRYELIDATVDQKTGRVVSGSTTEPQQVTELWTFYRPTGSGPAKWELSAIQQA